MLLNKDLIIKNAKLLLDKKTLKEGYTNLRQIVLEYPNSDIADDAFYFLATYHINNQELTKGINYLTRLLEKWPTSNLRHVAKARLEKLNQSLSKDNLAFNQAEKAFYEADYRTADSKLKEFIAKNPKSTFADNALLLRIILNKNQAEFFNDLEAQKLVIPLLQELKNNYPNSDAYTYVLNTAELKSLL